MLFSCGGLCFRGTAVDSVQNRPGAFGEGVFPRPGDRRRRGCKSRSAAFAGPDLLNDTEGADGPRCVTFLSQRVMAIGS